MRRSSTRKTGTPTSASSLNSAADLFRSASNRASAKEIERIDHLFNSYVDKSCGMIDPEGIENLCSDIQVDHTDVRILMLAWMTGGLRSLRADTIAKLKKALPELEKEVSKPGNFKDFYAYAFRTKRSIRL